MFSHRRQVLLALTSVLMFIGIFIVTHMRNCNVSLLSASPFAGRKTFSIMTPWETWEYSSTSGTVQVQDKSITSAALPDETEVQVVTVMCGSRQEEGVVMLKSLAALTTARVMLHIFCLPSQHASLEDTFRAWPQSIQRRVRHKLYNNTVPLEWQRHGWVEPAFRPCSNQRLYLPDLLSDVDAVLYLDSDLLLLAPVEELWAMFQGFNSTQLMGVAVESLSHTQGWYLNRAKHPYLLPAGVNSGVMLMNLTRLRARPWKQVLVQYSLTYRNKLPLGDQDIINVYLHFHPEQVKLLGCSVNYRTEFCQARKTDPSCLCQEAEEHGAYVLHGNRRALLDTKIGFSPVYDGFKKYVMGGDLRQTVKEMAMRMNLNLPCTKVSDVIFKRLYAAINNTT